MYSNGDMRQNVAVRRHGPPMSTLATARDIGLAIRRRRHALGWDQARLAQAVGASRQWIVEIERGKPRAELERVLRTLAVLGLTLAIEEHDAKPSQIASATAVASRPPIDIAAIVERASQPPAWLKTDQPLASAAKRR